MEKKDNYNIEDLLNLMKFLRSEKGCPWDKEQTHSSIKHNVVEEAYEVVDAINAADKNMLKDELGDLLMQVVFHAQMASEKDEFTFDDVVKNICDKLISRHTHLFGEDKPKDNESIKSATQVLDLWEQNKKKEKKQSSQAQSMKEITRALPSLERAYKIQKKAKNVGFDWTDIKDVESKIYEELDELKKEVDSAKSTQRQSLIESELGDLLFAVVNYSRFLGVDPELALDRANKKFVSRFEKVETHFAMAGEDMKEKTLEELDLIWDSVKSKEK